MISIGKVYSPLQLGWKDIEGTYFFEIGFKKFSHIDQNGNHFIFIINARCD